MTPDTKPQIGSTQLPFRPLLEMQTVYDLYPATEMTEMMNLVCPMQIFSPVNISALRQALQTLVERHDALRLNFIRQNGQLFQKVSVDTQVNFEEFDVSQLSWEELQPKLSSLIQRPFDLEQDETFLRVYLCKQTPNRYILLFIAHHIIIDGTSMLMLLHELRLLYQAYATEQDISLPTPKKSFWDYIDWYTARLSGSTGERLWKYWQKKLTGKLPILEFPTDYPRPTVQSRAGASYSFKISSNFTQALKHFSQQQKVTVYITMLAAYYILLHRYTGQKDFLVATTASNRIHNDFKNTVGCMADSIVLRGNWSDDPSFAELLTIVRNDAFQTMYHREYPFTRLVEKFAQEQDVSRPLLCQTSFLYLQSLPEFREVTELFYQESTKTTNFGGLLVKRLPEFSIWVGSWRELLFEFMEGEDYLIGHCDYNTDLFKKETAVQIVNTYLKLLATVIEEPTIRLSEITTI